MKHRTPNRSQSEEAPVVMGAQSWDALWADVDQGERVQILRAEDGWRSTAELAKSWNVTVSRASNRLREMVADGVVERARTCARPWRAGLVFQAGHF